MRDMTELDNEIGRIAELMLTPGLPLRAIEGFAHELDRLIQEREKERKLNMCLPRDESTELTERRRENDPRFIVAAWCMILGAILVLFGAGLFFAR